MDLLKWRDTVKNHEDHVQKVREREELQKKREAESRMLVKWLIASDEYMATQSKCAVAGRPASLTRLRRTACSYRRTRPPLTCALAGLHAASSLCTMTCSSSI